MEKARTTDPMSLDPELFKRWLERTGWTVRSVGRLGALYEFEGSTVAIPDELPRDTEFARDVAVRVAHAMGRSTEDVWKRLGAPLSDRVEYRLVGDSLGNGRVPLGAAMETLRNARKMLSTTGTSVVTPVRSIGRHYRQEAQVLARDAQLAHTEDGSFIFPLYIVLDAAQDPLGYEGDNGLVEPYERRVTRTLATALSTAVDLTRTAVDSLSDGDLDLASSVGVSREFCTSVRDMLQSDAVERVEVNFEWSQAFAATDALPASVTVSRSARPQLKRLADRLATTTTIDESVYSGDILQIGHTPDDESQFFCVLDTYYMARRTALRVDLTPLQHAQAIHWYEDRATVVVRGIATEQSSGLSMTSPSRVEAWGSDRLGVPSVE